LAKFRAHDGKPVINSHRSHHGPLDKARALFTAAGQDFDALRRPRSRGIPAGDAEGQREFRDRKRLAGRAERNVVALLPGSDPGSETNTWSIPRTGTTGYDPKLPGTKHEQVYHGAG
jgi:hypothetical protein